MGMKFAQYIFPSSARVWQLVTITHPPVTTTSEDENVNGLIFHLPIGLQTSDRRGSRVSERGIFSVSITQACTSSRTLLPRPWAQAVRLLV